MKRWVRISLLLILLALLVFLEINARLSSVRFSEAPAIASLTLFWCLAVAINLIVGYFFLAMTRDLHNNKMIAIFLSSLGLALLIIVMLLGATLYIWSVPMNLVHTTG